MLERYRKGDSILVHCLAGNQRSAIVVVAFLMSLKGWNKEESIEYLLKRKPNVFNFGTSIHFMGSIE